MSKEKHPRSFPLSYSLLFLMLLTRGWYLEALLLKNPLQAACSRGPDFIVSREKARKRENISSVHESSYGNGCQNVKQQAATYNYQEKKYHAALVLQAALLSLESVFMQLAKVVLLYSLDQEIFASLYFIFYTRYA